MLTPARFLPALALGLLFNAPAWSQGSGSLDSPRWTYELRGIYFRPDLPQFSTFYGNDHSTYFGIAGTYRLLDRLELGGEYGLMKEHGVGVQTNSGLLGGSVEYRLDSFHVFANWIFQNEPTQRVVPYVGAGLLVMRYEQSVELQPKIEGRTDPGWSARAGVRFQVASVGPVPRSSSTESSYWRAYMFLEAQHMSAKVDGQNLGGDAAVLGFRMEFNFH
jgi:opacity protein-like surface antigen